MKKIFLCFLMLAMLVGTTTVFAQEKDEVEISFKVEEMSDLPPTYIKSDIQLMSDENNKEEALAERLIEGWTNVAASIDVEDLGIYIDDISANGEDLYRKILFDNPLFYHVVSNDFENLYGYQETGQITRIAPMYRETDKEEIRETLAEIEQATAKILLCIDDTMSDFEKVMAVHDYMVLHYEYDTTLTKNTIKIMLEETGVCQSYALAFKHVMDVLGIDCTFVPSDAMAHAWNLVKIKNAWYHIDLTWDDPLFKNSSGEKKDCFAQVRHTYALYSSDAFQKMEDAHYGFDVGNLANAKNYDYASWRDEDAVSSIVSCHGRTYWIANNRLMRDGRTVIYHKLDGGDGKWSLSNNRVFEDSVYAGLAVFDGSIYFNTDTGIYKYTSQTNEMECILEEKGICGLFVDECVLKYCKYDIEEKNFYNAGSIHLAESDHAGHVEVDVYDEAEEEIVIVVENHTDETLMVLSFNGSSAQTQEIEIGMSKELVLDAAKEQTLYFWDSNLRPLREPEVITK